MTRTKKRILSATVAIMMVGVLLTSVLLNINLVVLASDDMMPGIETIVNSSSLKILEIVEDGSDAEMGAYVSGQEPWIKLYKEKVLDAAGNQTYEQKNFSNLEQGLKSLPSENAVLAQGQTAADVRKSFAEGTATYEKGGNTLRQFRDFLDFVSQDAQSAPLGFKEYEETYFPSDPTAWTMLTLDRTQQVDLLGRYEPVTDGVGDYTEDERTYLPVADQDPTQQAAAEYKENIYGFTYQLQGSDKPYDLTFQPVMQNSIASGSSLDEVYNYKNNGFGYYENVYQWVNLKNDEEIEKLQPQDSIYRVLPEVNQEGFYVYTGDITLDSAVSEALVTQVWAGAVHSNFNKSSNVLTNMTYQDMLDVKAATNIVMSAGGSGGETETETDTETEKNTENDSSESETESESTRSNQNPPEVLKDQVTIPEGTYPDGSIIENSDGVCIYYTWSRNENGDPVLDFEKNVVYITAEMLYVEGKQMVPQEEVSTGAYDGYYYLVDQVIFRCTKNVDGEYIFQGTYSAIIPVGEEELIKTEKGQGNFYGSDPTYTLTPQKGTHTFVPDENGTLNTVDITKIYYRGGYQNNDWLKRYVLHLDPGDGTGSTQAGSEEAKKAKAQFEAFEITVDTMTMEDLTAAAKESWKNDKSENKAAAFDEGKYTGKLLEDYQLVTLNGNTNESQSVAVLAGAAKKQLSVIINTDTVQAQNYQGLKQLAGWLTYKESADTYFSFVGGNAQNPTADQIESSLNSAEGCKKLKSTPHFVLNNIYFFSGTDAAGTGVGNTVNQFFSSQLKTVFTEALTLSGFSEITEYIDLENQLREIENAGKAREEDKYDMLSKEISQARSIEYILNYSYKRNLGLKTELNVLELEPADGTKTTTLSKKEVREWFGIDSDEPQINYVSATDNITNVVFDFGSIQELSEVNITPKNVNTTPSSCTIGISNDGINYTIIVTDRWKLQSNTSFTVAFDQIYSARYVRISPGVVYPTQKFTFEFYNNSVKVNISKMSTSEFAGKIGDLNNEYDAIFIGSDTSNNSYFTNLVDMSGEGRISGKKYPKYTESVMDGMIYTHVGDAVFRDQEVKLTGMMETDYFPQSLYNKFYQRSLRYLYSSNVFKFRSHYDETTQRYVDGKEVVDYSIIPTVYEFSEGNGSIKNWQVEQGNLGVFRKSGNDITPVMTKKLAEFAQSGYPVVTEDDIYLVTEDGSEKNPNDAVIDNTSSLYEFLEQVKGLNNVKTKAQAKKDKGSLAFYMNLPKPVLDFGENDIGKPPIFEGIPTDQTTGSTNNNYIPSDDKTLRYTFQIKDEAIVSHEGETYDCKLFADLNTDGNFARDEEVEDIIVRDEYDNLIPLGEDGKYHLKINTTYKVSRSLPSTYREIINWKLEVSNNTNSYIRCSQSGLSKIKQNEKVVVNVLQLMPDKLTTWNLTTQDSTKWDEEFIELMGNVEEFAFNIESINISEFQRRYEKDGNTLFKGILHNVDESTSGEPDMLILGFSDLYQNIDNSKGEVDDILKFINNGKSVLFAHDNVSFINYTSTQIDMAGTVSQQGYASGQKSIPFIGHAEVNGEKLNLQDWGYNMNKILRQVLGLDRFGITNTKAKEVLTKNNVLSEGTQEWETVKENAADMAYVAGSRGNLQTYSETQGYNNQMFAITETNPTVTSVSQVNEGVITQYPYQLDPVFDVAPTHGQYYQASVEQDDNEDNESDLVVWYCLNGYEYDYNDVRNSYYIYSNGNVMYTGVGNMNEPQNSKGITTMEKKLFINTIVASYHSAVRQPAVNFIENEEYNSDQKKYEYYSTDLNKNVDDNIIHKEQDLYFRVFDYNLKKSADESGRDLSLEFYIKTKEGEGDLTWNEISNENGVSPDSNVKQYKRLSKDAFQLSGEITDDGKVKSGKVYKMHFDDLSTLLRDAKGYDNCELYVTVSGTSLTYGKEVELFGFDKLIFRKQQLSDLD